LLSSFFQSVPTQLSRPCRHPSIRTLCERHSLGARWVFSLSRCCHLIIDFSSYLLGGNCAPGFDRSHLDSAVELSYSELNSLGHNAHRFLAIAQWFVHLPAYPQPMEQYCQRSASHGNYCSFLGIFFRPRSASFSPHLRRSQSSPNGPRMRSLHHHRSQIAVSFFADFFCGSLFPGFSGQVATLENNLPRFIAGLLYLVLQSTSNIGSLSHPAEDRPSHPIW
jgi:hypothetical protein